MKFKTIALLFSLFVISGQLFSQDYNVRFAFMGNSITIGAGLANAPQDCYPSQIQTMLNEIYGDTCIVENFAVSGRTLLKNGDFPLWDEDQFPQSLNFAPDIVFILLGTNDSKPYNWDGREKEFYTDYQSMIDTFKQRNPRCKFMVSYPPPAYQVVFDIRDSVILNGVMPVVDQILANNEAELVDFYYPLLDSVHLFPDFIHPGIEGSKVIAQMVVDKIIESDIIHEVETGYTFVTDISSSNKVLAQNSETTISWTSRNADSLFFDDIKVDLNGEIGVTPSETTTYTVTAYGAKNENTLQYTQTVYVPELTKMKLNPKNSKINSGESINLEAIFYDQENKVMENQDFDIVWSIIAGEGKLENETSNSVDFIGTTESKAVVRMTIGDVFSESTIRVQYKTGIEQSSIEEELIVFPNPTMDFIKIKGLSQNGVKYRLTNSNGREIETGILSNGELDIKGVSSGIYFLNLNLEDQQIVKKIIVQ